MYQPTGPLGPTQPPDLGLCAESEVRGPGGAHHVRSCHGRRSRDLGAAVGGRGRYGVHVGPVMSVDGGRACAGHPDVLGLAASTGWRGTHIYVCSMGSSWPFCAVLSPSFRSSTSLRTLQAPGLSPGGGEVLSSRYGTYLLKFHIWNLVVHIPNGGGRRCGGRGE